MCNRKTQAVQKDIRKKEKRKMWEKFKNSSFGKKCVELSHNRGAVIAFVCLLLTLSVVLSVSIATNRAKQKYLGEDTTSTEAATTASGENETSGGSATTPNYNETKPSQNTGAEPEEFSLSLPVSKGNVGKEHDATLQVWSATMGDYRVHLGIDIMTEENAPVYAAADGTVSKIWDDALMGRCVAVSHDGKMFTIYKNLAETLGDEITEGAKVTSGQQIGQVGESAIAELADEPHLHLEMTVNGLAVDPLDYFSETAKKLLTVDTSYEGEAVTQ